MPHKFLDPHRERIFEPRERHSELGERLVKPEPVFVVEFTMVVHTDTTHLHKMHKESFRRLFLHIADNERVRLDKGDELLLFIQDVLEVVQV